jgi:hypothetical protein
MGIAFKTEFNKVIRPPRLMNLFAQPPNRLRIEAIKGSHVASLRVLAPTGRPKYLKGTPPILQFRKTEARRMKLSETLTPKMLLFQKFTLSPETISKSLKIAFKHHKFSTVASPIHRVSSAYCKCEITTPPYQPGNLGNDAIRRPFS